MHDEATTISANGSAHAPAVAGHEANRLVLRDRMAKHPLWNCSLLRACSAGHLTRDDFAYVFSQYSLYSRNFTRFLAAAIAHFEDDGLRARLCRNLWEESGMLDVSRRHSELFRLFLRDGLGVVAEDIEYSDSARYFASQYLDHCSCASPSDASAFLALGTEAIVVRLYSVFVSGLRLANVAESSLNFFLVHLECDDEHAETLEQIMLSYSGEPGWLESSWAAADRALTLRKRFFDHLYQDLRCRRLSGIMAHVQEHRSLCAEEPDRSKLLAAKGTPGERLYGNKVPRLNIDFEVDHLPFDTEVLDARIVRISAGANNERHKHAHETVFVFVEGTGEVQVNGSVVPVSPGDVVFVPRWAMHQTRNSGGSALVFFAVTDFGLTGRLYVGDYLRTARLQRSGVSNASNA